MPRLIDADALMRRLCVQCDVESHEATCDPDECFVYNVIVYDAPTIEAEPVRHGTWEEIETYAFVGFDGNGSLKERRQKYYRHICGRCSAIKEKFCPTCGAKMDGNT